MFTKTSTRLVQSFTINSTVIVSRTARARNPQWRAVQKGAHFVQSNARPATIVQPAALSPPCESPPPKTAEAARCNHSHTQGRGRLARFASACSSHSNVPVQYGWRAPRASTQAPLPQRNRQRTGKRTGRSVRVRRGSPVGFGAASAEMSSAVTKTTGSVSSTQPRHAERTAVHLSVAVRESIGAEHIAAAICGSRELHTRGQWLRPTHSYSFQWHTQ